MKRNKRFLKAIFNRLVKEIFMTYADYLMSHYLALNAVVAVVALLAFIWLPRKIPKGWFWGLTGFLLAIAFAVLIAALVVAGYLALFPHADLLGALLEQPSDGLAFLLESGVEFGLIGIVVSLIGYLMSRYI